MLVSVHGSYLPLIVWNLVIRFLPYLGRCSLLHFLTISYEDTGHSRQSTVAALLAIGFLGVVLPYKQFFGNAQAIVCFSLSRVFTPGTKFCGHHRAKIGGLWSTRNITTVEDFFTGDNPCAN